MSRVVSIISLVLWCACSKAPLAPDDVDGEARWFLVNYDTASDADVADAIAKFHKASGAAALTHANPLEDTLRHLQAGDPAAVGKPDGDANSARGMITVTLMPCALASLQPLVVAQNQDVLHPGSYDSYQRTYTSDDAAFASGKSDTLTWTVDIAATPLSGHAYTETLLGGARHVNATAGATIAGPYLLARTLLPHPGAMHDASDYFRQDYQIDVFYERAPGETVHLFAVWRQAKFSLFDTDGDTLVGLMLSNFAKWDDVTAGHCGK